MNATIEKFGHQPCYKVEHACKACGEPFLGLKRRKFCSRKCAWSIGYMNGREKPGQEAVEHPTTMDIAWVAGIYEGEGSAFMASRSTTATISQVDGWLPSRLIALFGGHLYHARSRGNAKGQYRWQINGKRARGFLLTIYKFLSPRRQGQILVALGRA